MFGHIESASVTKSVSFQYLSSDEISFLLEDFRLMCNDAIRIAVESRVRSRLDLIKLAYPTLKLYGLQSHYALSACEVAYSVFRNKQRKSTPFIKRAFLKLDIQSYQLHHLLLRLPTKPRRFIFLTLNGSDYQMSFINDQTLRRGSVTITPESVIIAFSKAIDLHKTIGSMGIDINERNLTAAATNGYSKRFEEFADIVEIRERYREIRAKLSISTRGDRRTAKMLLTKFGRREKARTQARLHKITRQIVREASERKLCIKMEKLKGIRRLYKKGNGQGRSYRGRLNSWVFGETQKQIDYKAKWEGVPVLYVNPRGTSSYCLCGSRVVPQQDRKVQCQRCGKTWDRDDLASRNIMACVVPQARSSKGSSEGERDDEGSNPQSRWREGKNRRL